MKLNPDSTPVKVASGWVSAVKGRYCPRIEWKKEEEV